MGWEPCVAVNQTYLRDFCLMIFPTTHSLFSRSLSRCAKLFFFMDSNPWTNTAALLGWSWKWKFLYWQHQWVGLFGFTDFFTGKPLYLMGKSMVSGVDFPCNPLKHRPCHELGLGRLLNPLIQAPRKKQTHAALVTDRCGVLHCLGLFHEVGPRLAHGLKNWGSWQKWMLNQHIIGLQTTWPEYMVTHICLKHVCSFFRLASKAGTPCSWNILSVDV